MILTYCPYGRMQLRVTVTQGKLRGSIIQRQGQSVIKSPGLYYYYSDTGNGSDHLPSTEGTESLCHCSSAYKSPLAQHPSASKAKLITSTYMQHLAEPTGGRDFVFQVEGRKQLLK